MNTLMKRTNGNGNLPATTFSGLVDKIFQNNVNRMFDDSLWGFSNVAHNVSVPVNLKETDKSYELELVAPGLKKEDFKINLHEATLTISFDHQEEQNKENKEEGWLRREYQKTSFSRSFQIDDAIDADKISAKYDNGILQISLQKKETAQPVVRNIEIK